MITTEAPEHITSGVRRCITKATGLAVADVTLEKTLIGDLSIDSIDMIDLIYQIEDEFSIEIKIGELEKSARAHLGEKPFAIDNVITEEGLLVLQELMPEVPREKFTPGIMIHQIPYLFSVRSLCGLVTRKLQDV